MIKDTAGAETLDELKGAQLRGALKLSDDSCGYRPVE